MLWLLLIVVAGGLLFVIFHKPAVNTMGAGWVPPEQRIPPKAVGPERQLGAGEVHPEVPVAQAPMDFNDLFKSKPQTPPQDDLRS